MAALFYSASFKWTVVDMFDYGELSVITLIFHDRKEKQFDDLSALKQPPLPTNFKSRGFSSEIWAEKFP